MLMIGYAFAISKWLTELFSLSSAWLRLMVFRVVRSHVHPAGWHRSSKASEHERTWHWSGLFAGIPDVCIQFRHSCYIV